MGKIVVGMDVSPGASAALRWAQREADLRGWHVTAVLVWDFMVRRGDPFRDEFDPRVVEDAARRGLEAAVVAAVGPDAARAIERRVVADVPVPALVDLSSDADLLVIGARGAGGFERLLLGSVGDQCLAHATCPVAVIHADGDRRPQVPERVVVGVDGSPAAQRALRWALAAARDRQARITAVHAWTPAIADGVLRPEAFDTSSTPGTARQLLDEAVDAEDLAGVAVERIVLCAGAAAALLETARAADLVVVGSRGLGGFEGLLLGSVSHEVARHASCPVVVLPKCDFGP